MAAYELAAAYELCYAGAACLQLWAAHEARRRDEPLWQDAIWLRVALHAVLTRLAIVLRTPGPEAVAGDRLAELVAAAAMAGGSVTPFGPGASSER
jgi:uncharacterized membrane protein